MARKLVTVVCMFSGKGNGRGIMAEGPGGGPLHTPVTQQFLASEAAPCQPVSACAA